MDSVHYRQAVLAIIGPLARRAVRPETPARLRLWVVVVTGVAVALFALTSVVLARVQDQVRIIGDVAAPQAATAAGLYLALSDLDAQAARMVLIGDADALAGSRTDALGRYEERSRQVDTDLQRSLTAASSPAERAAALELMQHLAVYRQRVWQALTAGDEAPGYYTQAGNVLHLEVLPAAQRLRETGEERLAAAYRSKQTTEIAGVVLMLFLGIALLVLLVAMQGWLARRFRRLLNPALLLATALTIGLVTPAVLVLHRQNQQLAQARDESLLPFLDLAEARAISYDAAADTSRFLISGNLAYYARNFTAKTTCLTEGGACGRDGPTITGGLAGVTGDAAVLARWTAYREGHDRILALARSGRDTEAIALLTGIRRGDAAFDFAYYDAAVAEVSATRRAAFDTTLRDTRKLLAGWPIAPLIVLLLIVLLVPLSVRRRLAEYR
jgi:hypothetical protein